MYFCLVSREVIRKVEKAAYWELCDFHPLPKIDGAIRIVVEGDGWATWHDWCEDKHKVLLAGLELRYRLEDLQRG
jgi:hypothetical protein